MMEGSTSHNDISKSHIPASLHHWTHMPWQSKHLSCKFLILPVLMPLLRHIFHMQGCNNEKSSFVNDTPNRMEDFYDF